MSAQRLADKLRAAPKVEYVLSPPTQFFSVLVFVRSFVVAAEDGIARVALFGLYYTRVCAAHSCIVESCVF